MLHPLVFGTAGHVDHGKSSLVHALTGIDPDRLPIEKQRGITTELGFAHLDLGDRRISIVDVPGHERFIRAMAAGAGGIDAVCFVIAIDEGVMPQTREHLAICQLLGVRRGIVVLTKRDLVDDEFADFMADEVRTVLAGSFLDGAPLVMVSTKTGVGMDDLRREIESLANALPARDDRGVFRLPIDRIFTVRGFGTVVTGTIISGSVKVGDDIEIVPRGLATRVRGLEVHKQAVEVAVAGHRVAINIGGVSTDELVRGDTVVHPSLVAPSHILDVRFRAVAAARSFIRDRQKVLLHHGTTQLVASLRLDAADTADAGDRIGQLRISAATPIAALPGDHFIVRGFAAVADHGTTLGGGEIIRVHAAKVCDTQAHASNVRALASAKLEARISDDVSNAASAGRSIEELGRRLGIMPATLTPALTALCARGELLAVGRAGVAEYLHANAVAEIERSIAAQLIAQAERAEPTGFGLARAHVLARLPRALATHHFDRIIDGLKKRELLVATAERIAIAGAASLRSRTASAQRVHPLDEELLARFAQWQLQPPRPTELAVLLGARDADLQTSLTRLLASKQLIKIKPDYLVAAPVLAELKVRLLAKFDEFAELTPSHWKELTGASRRYTIPLAEYFDEQRVTLRVGDVRRRRA